MTVINEHMQISKEIVLAMIEKGIIIYPAKAIDKPHEISEYNFKRSSEIGEVYENILKHVVKAYREN